VIKPKQEQPVVEPSVVTPNIAITPVPPSNDSFIDLGGYQLPKIKTQNSGASLLPSTPDSPESPKADVSPSTPDSPESLKADASLSTPDSPESPKADVAPSTSDSPESPKADVSPSTPDSPESPKADLVPIVPVQEVVKKNPLSTEDSQINQTKPQNDRKLVALTPEHSKFIQDELVMFLIPDDDVVLGKVTPASDLEVMSGKEYINLFWQGYDYAVNAPKDYETEIFITTYNHHYVNYARFPMSTAEAKEAAFDGVVHGNLDNVRTMLDNYQILQTYDKYGNNLLIEAVEMNDVVIAKLLLLRGIDLYRVNNKGESALSISKEYGTESMRNLIGDAVFFGKVR